MVFLVYEERIMEGCIDLTAFVKEKNIINKSNLNINYNIFSEMIEIDKEITVLKLRIKNKMPIQKRQRLQSELNWKMLQSYLVREVWETANNSNNIKGKEVKVLNLLLDSLEGANLESNEKTQKLLSEYQVKYSNKQLETEKYKQQLKKTHLEVVSGLDKDYSEFLKKLNLEEHLLHSKKSDFKISYFEALATIVNYISPEYQKYVDILANKFGITRKANLVSVKKMQDICAPRLTLTSKKIELESWNILLLTEAMILIPAVINETKKFDKDLLHSLSLSSKEVKEIIEFTNLLKIEAFDYTKNLVQIKKYSDLNLYIKQFEQNFYRELEPYNKILVVGTMSSGKSTFLNSLLGKDLFPSKNEACTAKLFEYEFTNNSEYTVRKGRSGVVERFNSISQDMLAEWNESDKEHIIYIKGPVESAMTVNKKITFIDTPGPNNSMDASHRDVMEIALKGAYGKIFYLLNSTQLGTDDDVVLLQMIQDVLKKNPEKQLYFIVNKVDEFDNNENESLISLRENVLVYLATKGYKQPNVLFVSALTAKLVQNEVNGIGMSRRERNQLRFFKDMMIEEEYNLSKYAKYSERLLQSDICFNEKLTDTQQKLLIHSGLAEVLKCI